MVDGETVDRQVRERAGRAAAIVVVVGLLATIAFAARSPRPPIRGGGVTDLPWGWIFGVVLALEILAIVVVARQGGPRIRRRGGSIASALRLLAFLVVLVWILPRLEPLTDLFRDRSQPPAESPTAAPTETVGEPTVEAGSPVVLIVGAAGVLIAALAVAVVRRGRSEGSEDIASEGVDDGAGTGDLTTLDPRTVSDPVEAIERAYAVARRRVAPSVPGGDELGPMTLARRVATRPGGAAFGELTRIYLPIRFGTTRVDERDRVAAMDALDRIEAATAVPTESRS